MSQKVRLFSLALGFAAASGAVVFYAEYRHFQLQAALAEHHWLWLLRAGEDLERIDYPRLCRERGLFFTPKGEEERAAPFPGALRLKTQSGVFSRSIPLSPFFAALLSALGVFAAARFSKNPAESSLSTAQAFKVPASSALADSPEAVLRLSPTFEILSASPAAADLLETPREQLEGSHLLHWRPSLALVEHLRRGGSHGPQEFYFDEKETLFVRVTPCPEGWDLYLVVSPSKSP